MTKALITAQKHHWEYVKMSDIGRHGHRRQLRTSKPITIASAIRYPHPILSLIVKCGEVTCIDDETALIQPRQLIPSQDMTRSIIRPIKIWMLKPSWESHPRKAGFEPYANVNDVISDALKYFGMGSLSNTEVLSKDEFTFHYDDGFSIRFFRVCK